MTTTDPAPSAAAARDVDGYTIEMRYHYGYLPHLSPLWLRLAVLDCGFAFPEHRPLRYLELGYGTGVALNIHAAAYPGEYWGTDANPEHAVYARRLAAASGASVRCLDLTFTELLSADGLPEFDIITAAGIWSWISEESRAAVVDLLRHKLADGGLFYLTYNAMPGMAPVLPLQRLLRLHADRASPDKPAATQFERALQFVKDLDHASDGKAISSDPVRKDVLDELQTGNRLYNIHEYLCGNWNPCAFSEVATRLANAGLTFAASAELGGNDPGSGLDEKGQALVRSLSDPILQQTARDHLIGRTFRNDIFIKGKHRLDPDARLDQLARQSFQLIKPADEFDVDERVGTAHPPSLPHWTAILNLLQEGALTAAQMAPRLSSGATLDDVVRALIDLTGIMAVVPVLDHVASENREACRRFNAHVRQEWRQGRMIRALASPVAGAGIPLSGWHYAFEAARQQGAQSVTELMQSAKVNLSGFLDPAAPELGSETRHAVRLLKAAILNQKSQPLLDALEIS